MKSVQKIVKKNNRFNLGQYNRELVIRLAKKKNENNSTMYHLVLTRRRSHAGSRYDKLGYFEIKKHKRKKIALLGIDRKKFKDALSLGATFHINVYKILYK
jgi:ribosomal protein S16